MDQMATLPTICQGKSHLISNRMLMEPLLQNIILATTS